MLLEFASFLWLRRKILNAKRPYQVPLSTPRLAVTWFVPSCFLVHVIVGTFSWSSVNPRCGLVLILLTYKVVDDNF